LILNKKTEQAVSNGTARGRIPHAAYWTASLALAAVLLYFSLRGIQWGRVWTLIRAAQPLGVLAVLGLQWLALLIRAVRWRILLSAQTRVTIPVAFWATSAGYLGNNLLPARAGEVVRTVLIGSKTNASKAFILTTAFSERVADAIALIAISASVLLFLPAQPGWFAAAARPIAIVGLAGAAGIAFIPILEPFWFRVLARLPASSGLREKLDHLLRHVLEGLRSFHDRGRLFRFLALTVVIWGLDATGTVVGAGALGLRIGYPVAFLLIAGLGLGSALPSTPGYVGIYQFVAVSVLAPFGIRRDDAIAYILLFQALAYVTVLIWGLMGLERLRGGSSIFSMGRIADQTTPHE
jgi:glycosyltransferase 2 family protein